MSDWYGPDDPWPAHPKPWFRDALAEARDAGWYLRQSSAHSFGVTACETEGTERCIFPVYSTGKAGESAARELIKKVHQCPHRTRGAAPRGREGHLRRAAHLLGQAERLLDAAERLLLRDELSQHAATLLADAVGRAYEAEGLLSEAEVFEDDAAAQAGEARSLVAEAGHADVELQPAALADSASEAASEAGRRLARVGNSREKRLLSSRLDVVRHRIEDVRTAGGIPRPGD